MVIGIGQMDSLVGGFQKNRMRILEWTEQAKLRGVDLLVFPELTLCGYLPRDLLRYSDFLKASQESLYWLVSHLPREIGVLVGHLRGVVDGENKHLIENVASLIWNNEILFSQAKTLLPSYDVFEEGRYFSPAEKREVFSFKGETLGIAICEDIWWKTYTRRDLCRVGNPVAELIEQGASLILCPSASPYHQRKRSIRRNLVANLCREYDCPLVYANTVGIQDSLIFDGASMICDRHGELVAEAKAFEEELLLFDTAAKKAPSLRLSCEGWEDLEEALVMGIREYARKCHFRRVHLGLSGGIDSALVAILATKAMGPENVMAFNMPSRYSSDTTRHDSALLAQRLGIGYEVISIEELFSDFLGTLAPLFKGCDPDLTEENLQARIRGVLLMAYSNKKASLTLAAGNKSEFATGYATLYGDMVGGLAVIGDLFKSQVYHLCHKLEGRDGFFAGGEILWRAPSAELRFNQKDEDNLPPYEQLDPILEKYLEKGLDVPSIIEEGFPPETVRQVVALIEKSEHKRRQAPPILRVSVRAFGEGRRIPLTGSWLSGRN